MQFGDLLLPSPFMQGAQDFFGSLPLKVNCLTKFGQNPRFFFSIHSNIYSCTYVIISKISVIDAVSQKWWFTILEAFSLKKNIRLLFSLQGSGDEVTCLHGIRALNALALLLSHKCMQLLFYSYVNRTQMADVSIFLLVLIISYKLRVFLKICFPLI